MWRACWNELPTLLNLCRRKIVEEPLCPVCLREAEFVCHITWDCPAAQDVWGQCSRFPQKKSFPPMSFKELWFHLCITANMEILEEFVVISKLLWQRRNKFIFQKEFSHPSSSLKQAHGELGEMEALKNSRTRLQTVEQIKEKWTPPPLSSYKINWDAVVDKTNCRIGLGVVVRDHRGLMIDALRMNRPLFPDPLLAEAYGLFEATKLGIQLGLSR
ncbi:hypothetical protein F2P56_032989 [Juglans regia]|uniref:Reverse transcriptase zinc-binding domain-containing protein n=1 Tax=Juglans regia TaxID=51240 RepID=A0A833UAZ0_JUGRE|nr:hypothetical protein F2P56_032989 [Juglans regia]